MAVLTTATSLVAQDGSTVDIGMRRELFVDRALLESMEGCELRLKEPRDEGIALQLNSPWEGRFSGYTTVIQDGNRFRMYYRGLPDIGQREVTCVAESVDGKSWYKPVVWQHAAGAHNATNIVLADAGDVTHNFCPFLDQNPATQSTIARYKAIGGSANSGLWAWASADGLRWQPLHDEPVLKLDGWVFDSQNVVFWSREENQYVMYFRRVLDNVRAIARTTSADFIHWSEPVQMAYSDTGSTRPRFQLYTNQTQPYFRAPHIQLATPARFFPGRRAISEDQAASINVDPGYAGDISDAILMSTRGNETYDVTFPSALLRPGIGAENWVSRTNYPALGIVQTGPAEMSWFVNQNYGQPTAHVRRYSFRLDGLACATAGIDGASIVTRPIIMAGQRLELNYATSAAGSIQVELQDESGQPIEGLVLADCHPLIGNEIAASVVWRNGTSTATLAGKPIRIRFVLADAELYSFRFASSEQ